MAKIFRFGRTRRLFKRRPRRLPRWLAIVFVLVAAAYVQGATIPGSDDFNVMEADRDGAKAAARFRPCTGANRRDCVVDGDTVRIDGHKIRLADINAPETTGAQCAAERKLGVRAKLRLVELLNGGSVRVVRTGKLDTDIYGRELRLVTRGGHSLGETLVGEGLARPSKGRRRSWCY